MILETCTSVIHVAALTARGNCSSASEKHEVKLFDCESASSFVFVYVLNLTKRDSSSDQRPKPATR